MPKKIRVYELARELGLTNKEALDLCLSLGIGVKSHSSSIEDAQADRARRKADREGLRRDVQPEEPPSKEPATRTAVSRSKDGAPDSAEDKEKGEKGAAAAAKGRSGGGRLVVSRPSPPGVPPPAASPTPGRTLPGSPREPGATQTPATDRPAAQTGVSRPAAQDRTPQTAPAQVPAAQVPAAQTLGAQTPASKATGALPGTPSTLPKSALQAPAAPAAPPPARAATTHETDVAAPSHHGSGQAPGAAPAQRSRSAAPPPRAQGRAPAAAPPSVSDTSSGPQTESGRAQPAPPRPPVSSSGRPIPPPPAGPPRSQSGRPIPPPPGRRAPGGPRPAEPGGAPRPAERSGRPGGFNRGSGRPGGFSGGRGPGGGGFVGRAPGGGPPPPGARGGPGGRGRQPQRRPRRRRRNLEELEPTQLTTYTPSNAPIPEGEIIVERGSTPRELGPKLNRSAGDVIRFLFLQGEVVTATQSLSDDMIELFAAELGAQVRLVDPGEEQEAELQAKYFEEEEEDDEEDLRPRPPVVTVMGHVDHGKTMLLDKIRSANVVSGEAGGITQHIGAYQTEWNGHAITFIDTPGHEAFTAMRARGAQVTDIVVLVVAADDGVMPQTIEAIDHAKAAEVPIIAAINKIDKADADPNRVMQQLAERGLVPESWGGDTIVVDVSALQGTGIDDLLEQITLVAEIEELRANPEGRARAVVLEANLEPGRGPVATVIVENGTLRVGDSVVAGAAWGKAKALIDDQGDQVKEAPPSMPVQVLGFSEPPSAGDELRVTTDRTTARTIGEARERRYRVAGHAPSPTAPGAKLEDLFEQIQRGEAATLNLILKTDVQGTLEAITESLRKLEREEVKLSFVHRGVGGITEYDVTLAIASTATIIGFNVRPDRRARELAEDKDVEIRTYEVIYKLLEDIESAMVGMLAPEFEEIVTGEAEVRQVFRVPRVGAVAGCYVREGVITRGSKVRFLRDGVIIWKGSIQSLRRFKDDVREVQSGFECGIGLSDFQDLRAGDIIETFEEREIART
ncbi:MAG TPA: translation initiation factor IF-2 [Acidimicrobiales bacterium]|nr:translation initiation factor IF-2 [Acidimicrobiales bacterium]